MRPPRAARRRPRPGCWRSRPPSPGAGSGRTDAGQQTGGDPGEERIAAADRVRPAAGQRFDDPGARRIGRDGTIGTAGDDGPFGTPIDERARRGDDVILARHRDPEHAASFGGVDLFEAGAGRQQRRQVGARGVDEERRPTPLDRTKQSVGRVLGRPARKAARDGRDRAARRGPDHLRHHRHEPSPRVGRDRRPGFVELGSCWSPRSSTDRHVQGLADLHPGHVASDATPGRARRSSSDRRPPSSRTAPTGDAERDRGPGDVGPYRRGPRRRCRAGGWSRAQGDRRSRSCRSTGSGRCRSAWALAPPTPARDPMDPSSSPCPGPARRLELDERRLARRAARPPGGQRTRDHRQRHRLLDRAAAEPNRKEGRVEGIAGPRWRRSARSGRRGRAAPAPSGPTATAPSRPSFTTTRGRPALLASPGPGRTPPEASDRAASIGSDRPVSIRASAAFGRRTSTSGSSAGSPPSQAPLGSQLGSTEKVAPRHGRAGPVRAPRVADPRGGSSCRHGRGASGRAARRGRHPPRGRRSCPTRS